jgi:hypothetical protein
VPRGRPLQFADRLGEVVFRLGHRTANARDQLKRRLHQLVTDPRVLAGVARHGQLVEQLPGLLAEQLRLGVDELQLPFDTERRTAGRIPLDSHG